MAKSQARRKNKPRPYSKLDKEIIDLERKVREGIKTLMDWEMIQAEQVGLINEQITIAGIPFMAHDHPGLKLMGLDTLTYSIDEEQLESFAYRVYEASMLRNQAVAYGKEIHDGVKAVFVHARDEIFPKLRKRDGVTTSHRREMLDELTISLVQPMASLGDLQEVAKMFFVVVDSLNDSIDDETHMGAIGLPEIKQAFNAKLKSLSELSKEDRTAFDEEYKKVFRAGSIEAIVKYWEDKQGVFYPRFESFWTKLTGAQASKEEQANQDTQNWE